MSHDLEALARRVPLRAKVAQLVFPSVFGDGRDLDVALRLARAGVGGFVIYEGPSPGDTARLSNRLRAEAEQSLPAGLDAADRRLLGLTLAADQENGAGQVVKGATELPPQMAFAATGSSDLMRAAARNAAREGRAMGFNLNYAPVADYTCTDVGPVESVRTFGSDLDLARQLLSAYTAGYHEGGMATTAKHFPGRGGVRPGFRDPWWCEIAKPAARVQAEDFARFRHAIEAGVDMVMTEHIAVPSVAADDLPACVSEHLVNGCLRGELGFAGVITTDDLWYDKVCERFGPEEVGVLALKAGHDVLLKPRDALATIEAVVQAVGTGRLSAERVEASFCRLLRFKAQYGDLPAADPAQAEAVCATPAHRALAQTVADRAVTLLVNRNGVLPLAPERLAQARNILHVSVLRRPADSIPAAVEAQLRERFAGRQLSAFTILTEGETDTSAYPAILQAARTADLVLLSFAVQRVRLGAAAPLGAAKEFLLQLTASRDTIALAHGNPYVIPELPNLAAALVGWGEGGWFGNKLISVSSLLRALTGDLRPTGRLPVAVGPYPVGHGLSW